MPLQQLFAIWPSQFCAFAVLKTRTQKVIFYSFCLVLFYVREASLKRQGSMETARRLHYPPVKMLSTCIWSDMHKNAALDILDPRFGSGLDYWIICCGTPFCIKGSTKVPVICHLSSMAVYSQWCLGMESTFEPVPRLWTAEKLGWNIEKKWIGRKVV